jgi:hypothetical protein
MNGPEHYRMAEQLVAESMSELRPHDEGHCEADRTIAAAQVHALLALAAATALPTGAVGSAARDQWAHTIHFGDEAGTSDGR